MGANVNTHAHVLLTHVLLVGKRGVSLLDCSSGSPSLLQRGLHLQPRPQSSRSTSFPQDLHLTETQPLLLLLWTSGQVWGESCVENENM